MKLSMNYNSNTPPYIFLYIQSFEGRYKLIRINKAKGLNIITIECGFIINKNEKSLANRDSCSELIHHNFLEILIEKTEYMLFRLLKITAKIHHNAKCICRNKIYD
ncbi:hypothetical protein HHI36_016167 [Cryptolaemus montrouzieri]|uniref:Uncharacterized protein n=1 Tax=Cryptolaemus montrouzieri TaxID=559131 RepID=A0ABD2NJL3_9CUCU